MMLCHGRKASWSEKNNVPQSAESLSDKANEKWSVDILVVYPSIIYPLFSPLKRQSHSNFKFSVMLELKRVCHMHFNEKRIYRVIRKRKRKWWYFLTMSLDRGQLCLQLSLTQSDNPRHGTRFCRAAFAIWNSLAHCNNQWVILQWLGTISKNN